jgi:glutamyl-tRNA reductase
LECADLSALWSNPKQIDRLALILPHNLTAFHFCFERVQRKFIKEGKKWQRETRVTKERVAAASKAVAVVRVKVDSRQVAAVEAVGASLVVVKAVAVAAARRVE